MDQPQRDSRLDCHGEAGDRGVERRAAIEQMMARIREGLGMQVIAIMVQRYRALPRELWDLNSISDMGGERGITYNDELSKTVYERIISNTRYSIVDMTLSRGDHRVVLPGTLRRLNMKVFEYSYGLDLPETLHELVFDCPFYFTYSEPLVLPKSLRKLKPCESYSVPIAFPPGSELLELELGYAYNHPLDLPSRLKRMAFALNSWFNHPLALPLTLLHLQLGRSYNQPTALPSGIRELRVGEGFTHDLSLPDSLRKIEWCCNRPIQIPEGVSEVEFKYPFDKPVVFSSTVKRATFSVTAYTHPINFPSGLDELSWWVREYNNLVLPESLRKLTWASEKSVRLPAGLRELILGRDVPSLILPEGLQKFRTLFESCRRPHYDLPASVKEVVLLYFTFTHPTTLQHLIVQKSTLLSNELDLSRYNVHKVTIVSCYVQIKRWPQGLEELAFTVDKMEYPLRVPKGCRLVGGELPTNVIME